MGLTAIIWDSGGGYWRWKVIEGIPCTPAQRIVAQAAYLYLSYGAAQHDADAAAQRYKERHEGKVLVRETEIDGSE